MEDRDLDWQTHGKLVKYDQREFMKFNQDGYSGLADYGYLFVPHSCEKKSAYLHVVLHGAM